jgi:hypothetical protein
MSIELKKSLEQLNTEEIEKKVAHSMLTKEAHEIAIGILKERGVNTVELPKEPDENFHKSNFFKQKFPYFLALVALAFIGKSINNYYQKNRVSPEEQVQNSINSSKPTSVLQGVEMPSPTPNNDAAKK